MKDYYPKLATHALEEFLETGKNLSLPKDCPKKLKEKKAGVFVSFHKGDELRGCIGTYLPTQNCIGNEIIACAIAAGRDPRFEPIKKDELPELKTKVDVLSLPEKTKIKDLDPRVFGVIVKSIDGRKGLLLPDLGGVKTIEQQIEICRQKAGISPDEPVELYRFTVERHE
ncbi:MAG: AmmeMemoRadiSam system protein A [Candidatus Berkelbacteria bacterium]|nr:AmmeMemoRadiSam system protein A [Candidatus Berkelbacteria bacterium]